MKAPAFWWRSPGLASGLLGPAARLYGAVAAKRLDRTGATAPAPVLCVGNVTVGGSGKTPAVIALTALLRDAGRQPAILLRGYGGTHPGPVAVDPVRHGPREVGDEALLLARRGVTIVSRDRPAGAALAVRLGHDVIVMDDGMQNPSLRKNLTLAVFDGAAGVGNGCVLPAGPLRAPLDAQWPLIDAVLVVGPGTACERLAAEAKGRSLPVLTAHIEADPDDAAFLKGRRVLAFAGIGRPGKFFDTLRAVDADVVEAHSFPDHHAFAPAEIELLLQRAERAGLLPVTTEKDAVRLDPGRAGAVRTLSVSLVFDEPERVAVLLRERLAQAENAA